MNKLTETAPKRIWLQISEYDDAIDSDFAVVDTQFTTWCQDSVGGSEVAYVRADLLDAHIGNSEVVYASLSDAFKSSQRDLNTALARIAELVAELETERMRLAACGVVALANTHESAKSAREMKPEYVSASLQDVIKAVDREMALRERVAELERSMFQGDPIPLGA